jgi:FtsP/CotA-like multicopper oxidase with cupredoxin domain
MRIDIYNETDTTEQINWHGQRVSCPDIPAHSLRRLEFTPSRPGVYFYHSNVIAAARLDAGLYSGQFGVLLVEPADGLRVGDSESVLVLKGCEPFLHRTARGCEVGYGSVAISGRATATHIVHVLNASATEPHILELPGHSFEVFALDGHPVPSPLRVSSLYLSPGERVSARVGPAARQRAPWTVRTPTHECWNYGRFGSAPQPAAPPDVTLDVELTRRPAARSGFNRWSINGATFSTTNTQPLFRLKHGLRHRLRIHNTSDEIIPLHLQHHLLQIVNIGGTPNSGVVKDVVTVAPHQQVEVDILADNPGPALLYCTRQLHKDFGLMARVDYT